MHDSDPKRDLPAWLLALLVLTTARVAGGVNALAKDPEKPKITVETKTQEVSIGGSAMLELKVEGSPKPEIAW